MVDSNQVENEPDAAFWQMTDKFIGFANEQAASNELGVVNASFLFASARFNTFLIATQCGNKETFEAEKAAALEYFVNQYKIALTEHMADYQAKFDTYITASS
ncbi:MAG: DUF3144 domain-containing protein [Methylotenera sp.]|jgi:hypothetical protein|uniref:DUF3144 domain-containing protein n=1 Tax=Methylotenera sp. TaxID=2051956 RepID=UPI00271F9312|nr:DUF3144 domain-containing protein [Methylotenera sp.]MDO9394315.1 DUF3144 domain-containing protein [Methylotenera sp.]MDP1524141.1 DUF3144 domain-containing protein [Methylotenera sp.]MDP2231249.1 DUF3144 domain-containing protein [Methylotenera sp.]MDP3140385.1 DUF3144 domain-containing protein [Methylotenera sp.]MDP3308183.1 DUF3144 domain-containing protein [Methylotenera sp.]